MRMLAMNPVTPSLRWVATSVVLIIEVRTCSRCKFSFRSPGPLMIQMEATVAGYKRTWLMPDKTPPGDPLGRVHVNGFLPREHREVHTPVTVCEHCFQTVPRSQMTLFPSLFQPHYAVADRITAAEAEALSARLAAEARAVKASGKTPKLTIPKIAPRLEDL